MPQGGLNLSHKDEILSLEEIVTLVRTFTNLGVKKVKLTGGEPLVRKDVILLIKNLTKLPGLEDISLTTNGVNLSENIKELKMAGLKRVNISLDTLNREKFLFITGCDKIYEVLNSLKLSLTIGFDRVKVNMVVLKGINDEEINDFVRLSHHFNIIVRFIEFMPTVNSLMHWKEYFFSREEILERIKTLGEIIPEKMHFFDSPVAEYFKIKGYQGSFGIIAPFSKPFCRFCNRLRITTKGDLILCLHHPPYCNIRDILRKGSVKELESIIKNAILNKPKSHSMRYQNSVTPSIMMCEVGG